MSLSRELKVVLLGYHGMLSTGDDALASAVGWGLYKRFGIRKLCLGANPERMPVLTEPVEACTPAAQLHFGRFERKVREFLAVLGGDVLLYGGGSIFHDGRDYTKLMRQVRLARRRQMRMIGAIGVSLGPFTNKGKLEACGRLFAMMDFLALRDADSYQLACQWQLPYAPVVGLDLALMLVEPYGIVQRPRTDAEDGSLDVAVSLLDCQSHIGGSQDLDEQRRRVLTDALNELSKTCPRLKLHFMEFNSRPEHGDALTANAVINELDKPGQASIVPYSRDPSFMWRCISGMDVVIAMRFHASVFAYGAGVPFVMMDYHHKCSAFAKAVGVPSDLVVNAHSFESSELVSAVQAALDPLHERCAMPLPEAVSRAERSFDPLERLWFA